MDALFLLLLLAGAAMLWLSRRWASDAGLPPGRVIAVDLMHDGQPAPALIDPELNLTGRPDVLLETRRGRVPVEIKSGPAPDQPHASHVLQLMAYCRLVHAAYGRRPPHGILRYADRAFEVPYSRQAEAALRRAVRTIQAVGPELPDRSHHDPARCAGCGFQVRCDQRLAPAKGGWL